MAVVGQKLLIPKLIEFLTKYTIPTQRRDYYS